MGDTSGHGTHDLKSLLVGNGIFAPVHLFQHLVKIFQIINLFGCSGIFGNKPEDAQCGNEKHRKDSYRNKYDTAETIKYGSVKIIVVNYRADHPEVITDLRGTVGAYLPDSGNAFFHPPVGKIIINSLFSVILLIKKIFKTFEIKARIHFHTTRYDTYTPLLFRRMHKHEIL